MRRAAAFALLASLGCGKSGGSGPSGAQLQITAGGVSPNTISIPSGGQVTFTNKDSGPHQITSSACAELNSPNLSTGQSFTATLTGPKTCPFSDALNPAATVFDGTITVEAPGVDAGSGY
jgi:plastocyanin